MTAKPKRFLLGLCMALVIAVAFYSFLATDGPRYRAETFLLVWPPTNGTFAKTFPATLAKTTPGIIRLEMLRIRTVTPGRGTNAYSFRLTAGGSTPDEATQAADLAATHLHEVLVQDHGAMLIDVGKARDAHRFALFHDAINPWLRRMQGN
jgi:hypothetical protein